MNYCWSGAKLGTDSRFPASQVTECFQRLLFLLVPLFCRFSFLPVCVLCPLTVLCFLFFMQLWLVYTYYFILFFYYRFPFCSLNLFTFPLCLSKFPWGPRPLRGAVTRGQHDHISWQGQGLASWSAAEMVQKCITRNQVCVALFTKAHSLILVLQISTKTWRDRSSTTVLIFNKRRKRWLREVAWLTQGHRISKSYSPTKLHPLEISSIKHENVGFYFSKISTELWWSIISL